MVDSADDSTDGTSIKPVSSLRSHFESISSPSPTPSYQSARTSPTPRIIDVSWQREHNPSERASLDLSQRTSPWRASKEIEEQRPPYERALGPPVTPRPERPRSAILQRSPPLTPPVLKIDSPKSSVESSHVPKTKSVRRPLSPKPTHAREPGPGVAPPIPPHSPNYLEDSAAPIASSMDYAGHSLALKRNMDAASTIDAASNTDTTLANAPPPVNRAEKPKVPPKPVENRLQVNPEPEGTLRSDSVSPFTTPPSSDSSPGSTTNGVSCRHRQTVATAADVENIFSPRPSKGDAKTAKYPGPKFPPPKSKTANTLPQKGVDVAENVESRPGLPPRRMTEQPQQSFIASHSEARITSFGRLPMSQRPITSSRPPVDNGAPKSNFLPPPMRSSTAATMHTLPRAKRGPSPTMDSASNKNHAPAPGESASVREKAGARIQMSDEYPEASESNRRLPRTKHGVHDIDTNYDTRLLDICGNHVCTTGYITRAWDLVSGHRIMNISHGEQVKVTALTFKPGATADQEGLRLWLGTTYGDLMEVDIASQSVVALRNDAHNRREIVRIHRHQNSLWSLDNGGNLKVWSPNDSGLPDMRREPWTQRIPKGHSFSLVVHHRLWLATGKEIRVFQPGMESEAEFQLTPQPLSQPSAGDITSVAIVSNRHDRVYFGHTDGKITLYSTEDFSCLAVVNVSVYKINALAGAGDFLWAGFNTGMIYVYDTRTQPWKTKKDWQAHNNPVANILVDRSSVWKAGVLQVASIGTDNAIRLWDGMLEEDWLMDDMRDHDTQYCTFSDISALVVTWNAGASTPSNLRHEEKDSNIFRDVLQAEDPPDILVFGFQELVDLEDKKLTAKSLFKGNKKKDSSEQEHMSRQYRAWRDHLVRSIEDTMPSSEPFHLLHTASMVGLFSCVFVRASIKNRIGSQSAAEIKRGMGGLHGNKGCLILRFLIDDTSLCLVNCHLAAGQTQTMHRNNDVSAILESTILPGERNSTTLCDSYSNGGDGSMILDHEICILNGDLNYRIDTMGRDTVVKAVQAGNFTKLLERDQLLVSKRRNPLFRLRAFTEFPINFAPTYKYDVGTDRYDTSEKHRAPAWCDRILYRGAGKVKQLDYRRHELRISDHRPVSATFRMRIKSVSPERRIQAWKACLNRFEGVREEMARNAKVVYLRDVLGVDVEEAKTLV